MNLKTRQEALDSEDDAILKKAERIAELYALPQGHDILDVTEQLLESPNVLNDHKNAIISSKRRIFIFSYPSDNLRIKAFISIAPGNSKNRPLVMQFRGGNKLLGLPNPANDLSTFRDYTVLCTTLRGGINEGQDEFGGADVNDVYNLIKYIPELEQKLQLALQDQKMFMIAYSRGGMEMFLSLARFPELQKRVSKVVSLSGMLDLRFCMEDRSDMKEMFTQEFGLNEANFEEWTNLRDPLLTPSYIRQDLPILIVQGTEDIRVPLEEGHRMLNVLQEKGHAATYWEIDGGEHCLRNQSNILEQVFDWLEAL